MPWRARQRIRLIRNRANMGFAASANAGMRAADGHDVVLLNSDTLVAPGWLDDLRAVVYGAADIGTATPLSNDATILSYPAAGGGNPLPDLAETGRLTALARRVNGSAAVDIPVGVGFCLYIRRACLDAVGLLRADLFAQGYGEENDFCLRARHLGWRHVAAPGVFVGHVGGHSFGTAARHLQARNEGLLERLHPGYAGMIDSYGKADPLAPARRRLDAVRWRAARTRGSQAVVLVTHDWAAASSARSRQRYAGIAPMAIAPWCCAHRSPRTARGASSWATEPRRTFPTCATPCRMNCRRCSVCSRRSIRLPSNCITWLAIIRLSWT